MEVGPGGVAGVVSQANHLTSGDGGWSSPTNVTSVEVGVGGQELNGLAGSGVGTIANNSDVVAIAVRWIVILLVIIGLAVVGGVDGGVHWSTIVYSLAFGDEGDPGDVDSPAGGVGADVGSLGNTIAALRTALRTAIRKRAGWEKSGRAFSDDTYAGGVANT